ncbi:MAG: hypothetical protein ACI89L_002494 [Phycisphaerales bacterium]|jgi:hypothetical protein
MRGASVPASAGGEGSYLLPKIARQIASGLLIKSHVNPMLIRVDKPLVDYMLAKFNVLNIN